MYQELFQIPLLIIMLVTTLIGGFYAYQLYSAGAYRGPSYLIPLVVILVVIEITAAYIFTQQQSIILLSLPVTIFFANSYVKHIWKNTKTVYFISPKDLDYSNSLFEKISKLISSENLDINLKKAEYGESAGVTQNAAMLKAVGDAVDLTVLVLNQVDDNLFDNIIKSYKAHIPVILVDYPIPFSDFIYRNISMPAHISSDFEKGGTLAAQLLLDEMSGSGNVIIISGPRASVSSEIRKKAFISELINEAPEVSIAYCGHVNEWTEIEAIRVFQEADIRLKNRGIRYSGVFCCNDTLALGVAKAISNRNVSIVGYDGVDAAINALNSRELAGTIDVMIDKQASILFDEIRKALSNPIDHIKKPSKNILIEPKVRHSTKPHNQVARYKAILFDMDGLILENESQQLESFNTALEIYGIHLDDVAWRDYVGSSQRNIFLDLKKKHKSLASVSIVDLMRQKKDAYFKIIENNIKPAKGLNSLIEYLNTIPRLKLAIVSSSPRSDIIQIMQSLGLESHFHEFISALDIDKPKPSKDCYLAAANALGVNSAACLVLEDSSVGVQSAIAAGMTCIAVPNEYTAYQNLSRAHLRVDNLEGVIEYLKSDISARN